MSDILSYIPIFPEPGFEYPYYRSPKHGVKTGNIGRSQKSLKNSRLKSKAARKRNRK